EAFSSNEIDIRQLAGLYNKIRDVCGGSEVVYNLFDDTLSAFEPKIVEKNDRDQNFPFLNHFSIFM
ncbi:13295_t:CDS:2, partial [Racocetra persica]